MAFKSPNHTQTPNDLFDVHLKDMSESELKVVLVIIRQTLGWHKRKDPISLSLFQRLTGMSRSACKKGIDSAIERGLILPHKKSGRTTIYEMNISDVSTNTTSSSEDWSTKATSTSSNSEPVDADSLVVKSYPQNKEDSLKEKERKGADEPRTRTSPEAFRKEQVLKHPLWQAYAATYFAPPSFTQRNAKTHLEVIEALSEAGVKPEQLTAYMNKFDDGRKPAFVWLAERIPQIIAGRGGSKEQDELSRVMQNMVIIGRDA